MPDNQEMLNDSVALHQAKNDVNNLIDISPPDEIVTNEELKDIQEKFLEFSNMLLLFSVKYSSIQVTTEGGEMTVAWWKQVEQDLKSKVTDHKKQVRRATSGQQGGGLSDFQKRDLEIKEKHLSLIEESKKKSEDADKSKANAVAHSKYDEILTISSELDEFLDKVSDWKKATRGEVITAMKSLEIWSRRYHDLARAHREYNVATSTYPLPAVTGKVQEILQNITYKYNDVTAAIQEEDKVRELYSLAGASSEQVSLPSFSGAAGEDFSIFKSRLLLALEKNRVAAADKVEKLRSCLSDQALALVPEKTKDFFAAMEVLADVFGNPEKVLAVRMADLKKLGKCPPETLNGKWNYQAIVSFCLKVEVLVQDLLDLAEADGDEQLRNDVYSSAVRSSVQNLFSLKEIEKMRRFNTRGKEGLEEHLKFVKDFRAKAQTMVEPNQDMMVIPKRIENQCEDTTKRSFHHIFKKPKRFEDCRVCSTLDEEGIAGLFEDHLSDDVTGCPKFQAMTVEERKITCLKARICWKCCDKDIVFNTWHFKNCSVNKTHYLPNTCAKCPKCFMHG